MSKKFMFTPPPNGVFYIICSLLEYINFHSKLVFSLIPERIIFSRRLSKKNSRITFLVQLIRMAEYVSKEKSIPKSLDYMDTFSKGIQRRMLNASGIKKLAFRFEYNRLRKI